jgi:hypothetical protein
MLQLVTRQRNLFQQGKQQQRLILVKSDVRLNSLPEPVATKLWLTYLATTCGVRGTSERERKTDLRIGIGAIDVKGLVAIEVRLVHGPGTDVGVAPGGDVDTGAAADGVEV